jgi:hypothetical protein
MIYQLTAGTIVVRLTDNVFIPPDLTNSDYTEYLTWLEEGNTPLPNPDVQPYTWVQVLEKRDKLLRNSDWTMIPGCTVDQHAWAVYRQILRDIPQTFEGCDALEIVWPEKPSLLGPNKRKEELEVAVETPANVLEEHVTIQETKQEPIKEEYVEEGEPLTEEEEVVPDIADTIFVEPAEATIETTEEV